MRTVLLVVAHDAHFVELFRIAQVLKKSGKYKPVIWFLTSYPTLLRDVKTCRSEGWEYVLSPSPSIISYVSIYTLLKRLILSIPSRLIFLPVFASGLFKYYRIIKNLVEKSNLLVEKYKPVLLIVCEENVGYATHVPIRICHSRHIPTVIIPYTIANATEAAEAYYDSFEYQIDGKLINQFVAKKYPHWVYEYRGRKLLRLPAAQIVSMERSGYSPAHPWVLNSDETALIAVESEHMLEYYRNENLPEERLIVTGALYDDVLADSANRSKEMRNRLDAEMDLQEGLPLLLCALPPGQFPRECEFSEYESLASFWMETLSQVKVWNVVVSPHPRLHEKEIDELRQFGVKISNWDTASLVPLCDLYVASVSATIRWAIACGKPVVNYDVYQMNYSDYKNAGGVLTVFSKVAFKETIARLTSDRPYYEKIESIQLQEKTKWGRLDGKSSQRMLQLFDDVISGKIRRNG